MVEALVIKQISPARLREQALRLELLNAMRRAAKDIKKDFQATTKTWKHKVKFEDIVSLTGPGPVVLVGTDDEIYNYVNDGTDPHPIFPVKAKALRFRWGGKGSYKAKTKPRVIGSKPGGPTGPIVHRPYVQHPGTKARKFDEVIQKKWAKAFKTRMEKAMKAAAQASGHGIP